MIAIYSISSSPNTSRLKSKAGILIIRGMIIARIIKGTKPGGGLSYRQGGGSSRRIYRIMKGQTQKTKIRRVIWSLSSKIYSSRQHISIRL